MTITCDHDMVDEFIDHYFPVVDAVTTTSVVARADAVPDRVLPPVPLYDSVDACAMRETRVTYLPA